MSPISSSEKEMFRAILLEEMASLLKRMEHNDSFDFKKSHPHESVGELSSYDNHPADEGTELFEREKNYALFIHEQKHLQNVQRALAAIDHGSYGTCEVCGKSIPIERLMALPTATRCKVHSLNETEFEEKANNQQFRPFGADLKDVSFDVDYSWQEVAQWGTSETPIVFGEFDEVHDRMGEPKENYGYVEDYENMIGVDLYGNQNIFYSNRLS
ncbi:TraR/DksA C4-type zinc finger protein [Fervidibacillus halotolerans]|uniref:TraR/DksA C4-type zinc finger protein n=1 Tax=Fervidibacillus halotolerans TaxID=2980027 RepID=A0A9E8M1S9_9BACI|nr:TraR/DksA C4-type zinc finger protein [Fervidibacillus halotolerans]WAA13325.1 TraR/DksA C4-type zinc finger protein [Fervidibacillus halotolerans]